VGAIVFSIKALCCPQRRHLRVQHDSKNSQFIDLMNGQCSYEGEIEYFKYHSGKFRLNLKKIISFYGKQKFKYSQKPSY